MSGRGPVDLQLPLVLIDAREHRGAPREHRRVVDQELGAEIIAAVDHDVVSAHQAQGIVGVEADGMGLDANARD